MPRRVGRRGLIGTAATTAVVVGTAGAVSGHQQKKQQQKAQEQQAEAEQQAQPQQQPAAAPAGGDEMMAELQQLAEMHSNGILTDEEFATAKAKLLG